MNRAYHGKDMGYHSHYTSSCNCARCGFLPFTHVRSRIRIKTSLTTDSRVFFLDKFRFCISDSHHHSFRVINRTGFNLQGAHWYTPTQKPGIYIYRIASHQHAVLTHKSLILRLYNMPAEEMERRWAATGGWADNSWPVEALAVVSGCGCCGGDWRCG